MASKQSERAGSNPGRKVRVVAKVRGFSGQEGDSGSGFSRMVEWVSVNRENSEGVTIAFGEQSSSRYLVDYCYKDHEENEMIYSREVKPLVAAVFEGHNSTVIAHGAKGSGKTHVIQGSTERPGLAMLAMAEFLSMAEKNRKSIAISIYEVDHQEHAVDLLNPEQPPILVFEDRGRIQFQGLSQIPVKSIVESQNLYFSACSAQKADPKKGHESAHRSHVGLIVHVFSQNESGEALMSKMNFVDLAGYEDARKKSNDSSCLAETNRINKSIYALLNVCHALSTNESRVPYLESKLTHILQDSLRGTGKILLISCLNPIFCQDTIYMVSLASRSCQWIHRTSLDSTKKTGSSVRQMVTSHKKPVPKSVSATAKELHGSKSHINEKKASVAQKSAMKERKLFDEAGHSAAKAEKVENASTEDKNDNDDMTGEPLQIEEKEEVEPEARPRKKAKYVTMYDRAQFLPDSILLEVLNRMSTIHAVQTSAVSKMWMNLWKLLTNLKFESCGFSDLARFYNFVYFVLRKRDSSISLNSLEFRCPRTSVILSSLNWFLNHAVKHNVRHLTIEIHLDFIPNHEFSPVIFNSLSLESLNLFNTFAAPMIKLPKSLHLMSLKTLHLRYILFIASDNDCAEPFSSCTMLNTLAIQHCSLDYKVKVLCISNSHLTSLTIVSRQTFEIALHTPNIRTLSITCHPNQKLSFTCHFMFLEEVSIDTHSSIAHQMSGSVILGWMHGLANVRKMTLSPRILKMILKDLSNLGEPPQFARLELLRVKIPSYIYISDEELSKFVKYLLQNVPWARVELTP